MRVRLHPEARAELRDARRWYYERSPLSATAFAHAVDNAVSRIREAPNSFPLTDHGTRKFVLQRFPFNVFYRAGEVEIVIVDVAMGAFRDRDTAIRSSEPTDGKLDLRDLYNLRRLVGSLYISPFRSLAHGEPHLAQWT